MSLSDTWEELEAAAVETGTVRRRLHPEGVADMHLVLHKPGNERGLLLDFDVSDAELPDLPSGRGVQLRTVPATAGGSAIELVLAQPGFADLFDALIADVSSAVTAAPDLPASVRNLIGRIRRWQAFLEVAPEGLGADRQKGLYGELYFLERHLLPSVPSTFAVTSWTGPIRDVQDFSLGSVAVEVKTTAGKQHQRVRIASERQLDDRGLEALLLFHLSVDDRENVGDTLSLIIQRIRGSLGSDASAAAEFEGLLFAAGYHDIHAPRYRTGYTVREANIFRVTDGFPRITEVELPEGVGDLSYSVALSACTAFRLDFAEADRILRSGP